MKKTFLSQRLREINSAPGGLKALVSLMKDAQFKKMKGVRLIDCSLGETCFPLTLRLKEVGKKAIQADENSYVKPFFGLKSLRQAISLNLKKEKIKVAPADILVTAGAGVAIDLFFRSLLNNGDEVIVFDPFYPVFVLSSLAYGGKVIFVDTYKTKFIPYPKWIEKKITKRTKIIVVNSPNNPTGVFYPLVVLKEIIRIAKKYNLYLLSDEVYADYLYEGKFVSLLKLYPKRTIIIRSFSKKCSMMGYKVGYMTGPRKLMTEIKSILLPMHSGPRISEIIASEATKYSLSNKTLQDFKYKRNFIYNNLKDYFLDMVKPAGAFYFYLKAPNRNACQYSLELLNRGVLVSPAFSRKKTHFRISYAGITRKDLRQLVSILKDSLLTYSKRR